MNIIQKVIATVQTILSADKQPTKRDYEIVGKFIGKTHICCDYCTARVKIKESGFDTINMLYKNVERIGWKFFVMDNFITVICKSCYSKK